MNAKTTTLIVDGAERTFTSTGAVLVYLHNDAPYARCEDCRQGDYVRRGGPRHNSRCDLPKGAVFETTGATPAATKADPGLRVAADEHRAGVLWQERVTHG